MEEIPAFDLLLVRNGPPRGQDGGGGGNFRRESVGFYGVGTGMTSVAGGQVDGVGGGAGVGSDGKVNGRGINGGRGRDRVGGGCEDVSDPRLVPSGRCKAGLKRLLPGLLRVLRYLGLRGSSACTTDHEVHQGQSQSLSGATGVEGEIVGASGKEPRAKPAASRAAVATTVAAQDVRGAGPPVGCVLM